MTTNVVDFKGRKVLVVDDSADNQMLLKVLLGKKGIKVETAWNGLEGMTKALAGDFDLILMDMQMPVMDGYAASSKLREAGYVKPIAALTAHAMKEDRQRCLDAGCSDYMTKPLDSALFEKLLQRTLMPCEPAPIAGPPLTEQTV